MSETKWTRGPWAINEDKVESENDHGWANDGWCVCVCNGPDQEANARLIAAAPTMAESLEIVRVEILKMREDVRVGGCSGVTAIAVIDAALAKARGE